MAKSDVMREILIRKVRDHRDKGSTRSSLDILGDKKDIWRELDQGPTQNPMHISEDEEEAVIARQFSPMIEELANKVFINILRISIVPHFTAICRGVSPSYNQLTIT